MESHGRSKDLFIGPGLAGNTLEESPALKTRVPCIRMQSLAKPSILAHLKIWRRFLIDRRSSQWHTYSYSSRYHGSRAAFHQPVYISSTEALRRWTFMMLWLVLCEPLRWLHWMNEFDMYYDNAYTRALMHTSDFLRCWVLVRFWGTLNHLVVGNLLDKIGHWILIHRSGVGNGRAWKTNLLIEAKILRTCSQILDNMALMLVLFLHLTLCTRLCTIDRLGLKKGASSAKAGEPSIRLWGLLFGENNLSQVAFNWHVAKPLLKNIWFAHCHFCAIVDTSKLEFLSLHHNLFSYGRWILIATGYGNLLTLTSWTKLSAWFCWSQPPHCSFTIQHGPFWW